MLRDRRMLLFVLGWFGLNWLLGLPLFAMPGVGEVSVAWQAHIGGFVGGLLAFSAFDPVPATPMIENEGGADAQSNDDRAANR
jgi:membrane associated rhomboid family serine protease